MKKQYSKPMFPTVVVSLLIMFLVVFGSGFYVLSSPDNITNNLIYLGCQSLLFVGCVYQIVMYLKKYIDYKFEELKNCVGRIEDIRVN